MGTLFFTANQPLTGTELWKSDGTASGTVIVSSIAAGTASSSPQNLTAIGSTVYFSAQTSEKGRELYSSDGTTTQLVKDIVLGTGSSNPREFVSANGSVYFLAAPNLSTSGL